MRKILFYFLSVYLTRDFDFRFLSRFSFPPGPSEESYENSRRYLQLCVYHTCIRALGKLIRAKKLEAEISCQTPFKGTLLSNEKDGGLEWGKLWILLDSLYIVLLHIVTF
jgi:hypothetical protein